MVPEAQLHGNVASVCESRPTNDLVRTPTRAESHSPLKARKAGFLMSKSKHAQPPVRRLASTTRSDDDWFGSGLTTSPRLADTALPKHLAAQHETFPPPIRCRRGSSATSYRLFAPVACPPAVERPTISPTRRRFARRPRQDHMSAAQSRWIPCLYETCCETSCPCTNRMTSIAQERNRCRQFHASTLSPGFA